MEILVMGLLLSGAFLYNVHGMPSSTILIKSSDGNTYGMGQVEFVELTKWEITIKKTEDKSTGSVDIDTGSWSNCKSISFQFPKILNTLNSQVTKCCNDEDWTLTNVTPHTKDGNIILTLQLKVVNKVSLVQNHLFSNITFIGFEIKNSNLLILKVDDDSKLLKLFENTISPILEMKRVDSTQGVTHDILIESVGVPIVKLPNSFSIAVVKYSIFQRIIYGSEESLKQTRTTSNCYIKFNLKTEIFGIGRIDYNQTNSFGTLWIENFWDATEKSYKKSVVTSNPNAFDKIRTCEITIRDTRGNKNPDTDLRKQQWTTLQPLAEYFQLDAMTKKLTVVFNFGVMRALEQTSTRIENLTVFQNSSALVLTLTSEQYDNLQSYRESMSNVKDSSFPIEVRFEEQLDVTETESILIPNVIELHKGASEIFKIEIYQFHYEYFVSAIQQT